MQEIKRIIHDAAQPSMGVSQFTIDWGEDIEEKMYRREQYPDECCSENTFMGSLCYDVDNILAILKPELTADVDFFNRVLKVARADS